jgi:hypothetical protein
MDHVVEFSKLVVVGQARGKSLGTGFLRSWVETSWGSKLYSFPSIRLLARGWFYFVYKASSNVDWVLSKTWTMVGTPIVLKHWTPNFDAKRERVDVVSVWVQLSGLPMQFWNPVHFSSIGSRLGEFLEADYSFEETGLMKVARILVRLDLRPGLLKEMKIKTSSGTFLQPLDYEGIPFRFHRCHAYGHGVVDCKLPCKGNFRGTWDVGSGPGLDRAGQDYGVTSGRLAGISPAEELGSSRKQHKSPPVGPSSVDRDLTLTKAQKSSWQACPRTHLTPGKHQFSFPLVASSIFYLALPLATLGLDLPPSLGLPSPFPLPRPVSSFFSLPSGALFPSLISTPFATKGQVSFVNCSCGDPLVSSTPMISSSSFSLPLETNSPLPSPPIPPGGSSSLSAFHSFSNSQSPEWSRIRYTLRNRAIFSETPSGCTVDEQLGAGLGSLTRALSSTWGRGRHSHFLLAQDRAKLDVVSGRQSSIEWALREKQPQEMVTS